MLCRKMTFLPIVLREKQTFELPYEKKTWRNSRNSKMRSKDNCWSMSEAKVTNEKGSKNNLIRCSGR